MTPQAKLAAMYQGHAIITNDSEMETICALDDTSWKLIRSAPNPNRVGLRDQYVAWIGEATTPPEVLRAR